MSSATSQMSGDARSAILGSIRKHIAESRARDSVAHEVPPQFTPTVSKNGHENVMNALAQRFCERLESVGGHCALVHDEIEAAQTLKRIIVGLRASMKSVRKIALSDAPQLFGFVRTLQDEFDRVTITPSSADLFDYDIGITAAQAAIAETGTLVLEADRERHRLISLLPPVHIAFVKATDIRHTLGEALAQVRRNGVSDISRAITFITGPSRTADIELTLTVGVHGPKELYVIIYAS